MSQKLQMGINEVSNHDYHADTKYMSSSNLKLLLKDREKFYREKILGEREQKSSNAFDVGSQKVRWQFETGGIIRSGAEIANGTVFFASDDGFVYALEADSGAEVWRFDLGSSGMTRVLPATDPPYEYDYLHSSPVYHEGTIYIGSADGALYAVAQESGQQRWRK